MVDVKLFSTDKEAEVKLTEYFSGNQTIFRKISTQLEARHDKYLRSAEFNKRHSGNKNAVLEQDEISSLCKGLGTGEAVISVFKLYAFGLHSYGFNYMVFDSDKVIPFSPYDSIDELTSSVRKQIKAINDDIFDFKYDSFFYTVLEPYTFSEKEKFMAREILNYTTFSLEERLNLDRNLDNYLERGLTPVEIKEFKSHYAKFLN